VVIGTSSGSVTNLYSGSTGSSNGVPQAAVAQTFALTVPLNDPVSTLYVSAHAHVHPFVTCYNTTAIADIM
jgi:hypothetical protein